MGSPKKRKRWRKGDFTWVSLEPHKKQVSETFDQGCLLKRKGRRLVGFAREKIIEKGRKRTSEDSGENSCNSCTRKRRKKGFNTQGVFSL